MHLRRLANAVLSTTLSVTMAFALLPGAAFASEQVDDPTGAPAVAEEGASPALDDPTQDPTQNLVQEPAANPALDAASPEVEVVETQTVEPGTELVDVEEESELKQQSVQVEEVVPEVAGDVGVVAQDAKSTAGDAVSTQAEGATVSGAAHIQGVGWSRVGAAGSVVLGAAGKGRRLEALKLQVGRPDGVSGGIRYRTHAQKVGWQGWASDGGSAGTVGKSLRLEALRIELTGELSAKYDIYYRAYVQGKGWLGWTMNGGLAGTAGCALRLEAVEVALVPAGEAGRTLGNAFVDLCLNASAQVQRIGWTSRRTGANVTIGTHGRSLRLEAFRVNRPGVDKTGSIVYQAHVQRKGWMGERRNGQVAGTVGQGLRVEAVRMHLTGELASSYDLWYRVHVSGIGWLAWAANGASAGTQSLSKRVEAIQIALVSKGAGHPAGEGNADIAFVQPKDMYRLGLPKVSGDVKLDMMLDEFVRTKSGTGSKALRRAFEIITNYPYRYQDTEPKGTWRAWSIPYAKDMYTNKSGNCFRYASLICWVARRLGYNAKTVSGFVYTSSHMRTPHGWCEITKNGKKYVVDPNMYHNYRDKNWFMVTYAAAPIEYLSATGQYR